MCKQQTPRISVIVLTLNAEKSIADLIVALNEQTIKPIEIIILDSESMDCTVPIAEECGAKVLHIKRSSFNHGGTRDYGLQQSKGDFILFLTHDAIPAKEDMIEQLHRLLVSDEKMAAVYARQLPRKDARYVECVIRAHNYPAESHVYSLKDVPLHGIKTFFMSDVCAMYRRDIYCLIGGFETDIRTNEDMIYSAHAIRQGYNVGYAAQALVIHSHNLSMKEQYQRNYVQGYEIERHKELLCADSQNSAGVGFVKHVSLKMLSEGRFFSWIRFGFDCCARYIGSFMGKRKARNCR